MSKKTFPAALTMKELKKASLASFLITLILVLSSATVHAFEVTDTITLEKHGGYYCVAYDSGKGEIFVTYSESHRVSVISDSSLPLPSPSIPEYPSFIVVSFLMVMIFLTAILYRGKHQIETRIRKQ
jgi:hypothetical protein